ncbi:hypothetical protein ACOSQ3_028733 [Xanthoceras sorbifolium]
MRIIVQVLAALLTTIPCYVTALASDRRYLPYPLTYTNRLSPSHRSRSRCNPYSVLWLLVQSLGPGEERVGAYVNASSENELAPPPTVFEGESKSRAQSPGRGKGTQESKGEAVSSCCPNTHPIDISATDKYNNKGLPGVGRTSTGGFISSLN